MGRYMSQEINCRYLLSHTNKCTNYIIYYLKSVLIITPHKTVSIIKLFILESHYVPHREHSPSQLQRRVMTRDHKCTLRRQLKCLLFLSDFNRKTKRGDKFCKKFQI
jgi:hypothetical protein